MTATEGFMKAKIERLEEENKKLKEDLEKFSEAYKRYRDYEKEEIAESCYDLERENQKLKYIVDSVMEEAGIEYIRLADGDVFMNPKNKLHISDTIQIDILNNKQ